MVMAIKPAGKRQPKLNRVLISGGGGSGKTTLAAKFASHSDRALFISTDGNASRQGYRAIDFEFPENAEKISANFMQALNLAESDSQNWDVLVIDLIEDFDERAQTMLRNELSSFKTTMKAWGKINSLYKDMQSLMMSKFKDKTVILLSRDVEEIDQKTGEVIGYKPALRKALKNLVLKDQDAEIRAYFDRNGNRQFDISNLRYEETKGTLQQIISKPIELPQNENDEKKNKVQQQLEKGLKAAAKLGAEVKELDYWRSLEPHQAVNEIADYVRIQKDLKQAESASEVENG